MENIIVHTDGGARGNPGPAGIGFVVSYQNQTIVEVGEYIGETTNNTAEYVAVQKAVAWMMSHRDQLAETAHVSKDAPLPLKFNLDSNLVVNQLKGVFKIKQPHLAKLNQEIHNQLKQLNVVCSFNHVYREYNRDADRMVNTALDQHAFS